MPADHPTIHAITKQLSAELSSTTNNNPAKSSVLQYIFNQLQKMDSRDHIKLDVLLNYLERIKFEGSSFFFTKQPPRLLGKILKERNIAQLKVDPSLSVEKAFNEIPLPIRDIDFLVQLYDQLRVIRENIPLVWYYNYPINPATGNIHCDEANQWQFYMTPPKSSDAALADFTRSVRISDNVAENNHHAEELLLALTNKTANSDENKNLLLRWLKCNGGQECNRIIDLLINKGEFSKKISFNIGISELRAFNWDILHGTIQGHFVCDYYAINQGVENSIAMQKNGELLHNPETIHHAYKADKLYPLMRAEVNIKLTVKKGQVIPNITMLQVSSFSNALTKPEEKQLPAKKPDHAYRPRRGTM